ncbi:MAG: NUDIX hydrolase [Gammaproteobacteria bacterium]|nr:NUDIX hydrolase [Gammaproteobacteria bacterium]
MPEHVKPIWTGQVLQLNLERVRLPNGALAELEIAHHPGGAAVVAVDDQQRVCLLHQFRHAAGGWLWELPAGKIDNREPPLATAQRELAEEAGMSATHWQSLGDVLSSPGVFTEVVHLYLATGLGPAAAVPEPHEVFRVDWRPLSAAVALAHNGELRDGKTVIGILRAAAILERRSGAGGTA